MDWFAEVELTGPLTQEQLEQAAEGALIGQYNEASQVLRLNTRLDAVDYTDAAHKALRWAAELPAVRARTMSGPQRLLVESAAARAREWDLLGAKEIAERLGVSTARVRQLEQRPDFPTPVSELAGGRVYRAADIDEFARRPRTPGRPPKA